MRLKMPQGNVLVLAVLRSPAHRVLSALALELRYTGRRSGRRYALPVQYARADGQLVLWPQNAERKRWWRNFLTPQPVSVRLAGSVRVGTAVVVDPGDPTWDEVRSTYASRWPRMDKRLKGPFVVISLEP